MTAPTVALLHYSGPPGIGGVEATIAAHARLLADDGYRVRIVAGKVGSDDPRIEARQLPLLGSRAPQVEAINRELDAGVVSPAFHDLIRTIEAQVREALDGCQIVIVHNVHTLHKNLALTAALHRINGSDQASQMLAWAHDFAWRDPLYLPQLHDGWPWSLLREPWPDVQYVAVSEDRRIMLADLIRVDPQTIAVVTPGVDVNRLLKLEDMTQALVREYNMLGADPLLVLPARITRRKNIEFALRIVAALRDLGLAPLLVVTGPPGPHNPSNAAYLAELQALRNDLHVPVVFLYEALRDAAGMSRPVTDQEIADWFSLADGLLFPSRSEGFGMPVIEAGLRGTPIFCADIPPFREIVGTDALRFALDEPPTTVGDRIATALRSDPRYSLRRRVRTQYTWQAIYDRSIRPLLQQS